MRVRTLTAIPSARGIIPAGIIIEIPESVMRKLKGKVTEVTPLLDDNPSHTSADDLNSATIVNRIGDVMQEKAWPPDIQSLIDWFSTLEPPPEPFYLADYMKVLDPIKFFEQLRFEIKIGPAGPRARLGTLQSDLKKLKAYFN